MNIDERLQALTETVELMAAMPRDSEQRFDKQFDRIDKQFDRIAGQFSENEQLFGQVALRLREATDGIRETRESLDTLGRQTAARYREVSDNVNTLARIAGAHQDQLGHDKRLDDLEQGPQK